VNGGGVDGTIEGMVDILSFEGDSYPSGHLAICRNVLQ
jgi:hypothetical protein